MHMTEAHATDVESVQDFFFGPKKKNFWGIYVKVIIECLI